MLWCWFNARYSVEKSIQYIQSKKTIFREPIRDLIYIRQFQNFRFCISKSICILISDNTLFCWNWHASEVGGIFWRLICHRYLSMIYFVSQRINSFIYRATINDYHDHLPSFHLIISCNIWLLKFFCLTLISVIRC